MGAVLASDRFWEGVVADVSESKKPDHAFSVEAVCCMLSSAVLVPACRNAVGTADELTSVLGEADASADSGIRGLGQRSMALNGNFAAALKAGGSDDTDLVRQALHRLAQVLAPWFSEDADAQALGSGECPDGPSSGDFKFATAFLRRLRPLLLLLHFHTPR